MSLSLLSAGCYKSSALVDNCRGIVTPTKPADTALRVLRRLGLARTRDLDRAGVTRTRLRRLLDRGQVVRVGRGLYALPGSPRTERSDLAEAARRVPGGVICLLSALRFHGLTTQNPFEVWIAIDRKAWRPKVEHPPMRLIYLSGRALREGVEVHDVGGVELRVFSAAKTVADCFKFRNRIGSDVAVEALRAYRSRYPKRLEELWRCAEAGRVGRVLRPYLESLG
ncbi:MAG TPA: type IV toxin-antitoxin system AbiEi family antitoxin domain-containing protein [Planctomycetota bacterium]|nr:type IV toxin-antitoxin system AbiEi family antitoxin domain-containing protein [Planctomycetota bacterium]